MTAMADVTFYTNPMSRGRIARWMLEEVGCDYEAVLLDFGTTMKGVDYLAINPMGKVPAIRHGDTVVTECAAICAYLADAFPDAGLAPALPDRGAYYRWLFFAAGPVETAVTNNAMGFTLPTEKEQTVGYGSLSHVTDTLEGLFADGRSFVLGDDFSAADVYLGSQIAWSVGFKTMELRPGFADYIARLDARPARQRATEKDNALMPQQGAG
ncbi:glutathione S-transferase family protein [Loktanella agnita]|uniref:glutathione S-transferase family protein n=1 Tax=Loktanella agnita TaxID=287097 RepID=UPI003986609A